ncbi:hypothetical protein V6N13_060817 [Hibiscus sabdariffa]
MKNAYHCLSRAYVEAVECLRYSTRETSPTLRFQYRFLEQVPALMACPFQALISGSTVMLKCPQSYCCQPSDLLSIGSEFLFGIQPSGAHLRCIGVCEFIVHISCTLCTVDEGKTIPVSMSADHQPVLVLKHKTAHRICSFFQLAVRCFVLHGDHGLENNKLNW